MTIRQKHQFPVKFPLIQYFQQLFACESEVRKFNPFQFWRRYRIINHLEACWSRNLVQDLERCYQAEYSPVSSQVDSDFLNNLSLIPICLLYQSLP